jgi:hypothetical protein
MDKGACRLVRATAHKAGKEDCQRQDAADDESNDLEVHGVITPVLDSQSPLGLSSDVEAGLIGLYRRLTLLPNHSLLPLQNADSDQGQDGDSEADQSPCQLGIGVLRERQENANNVKGDGDDKERDLPTG